MSKKWKKDKNKVTSARQHLLNEHIYMPGIVLRIFHSHHQNLMKWDYPSFQMRKVRVRASAAHRLKSDEARKAQDCRANV